MTRTPEQQEEIKALRRRKAKQVARQRARGTFVWVAVQIIDGVRELTGGTYHYPGIPDTLKGRKARRGWIKAARHTAKQMAKALRKSVPGP